MPLRPQIKKLDLFGVVNYGESDPSGAENGELFYNTTDSALKIYLNSNWVEIGGGVAGGTFDFMDGADFQFMDGAYFDFMDG